MVTYILVNIGSGNKVVACSLMAPITWTNAHPDSEFMGPTRGPPGSCPEIALLTHWPLVMPYDELELGQH